MKRLVVILGLLPPPVTGAAKNTALMIEEAKVAGAEVIAIPTSGGEHALQRSVRYHLRRLGHARRTLGRLRAAAHAPGEMRTLYLVPDGGRGLVYTYFYLRFSAARFAQVFLHHRTFGYIDAPSPWMTRIIALLGRRATHIFLSEGQRAAFERVYGPQTAMISTNALYVEPRRPEKVADVLTLGHLSNLCELKGFHDVVATFEAAVKAGLPVRLKLAGPVVELTVQAEINRLIEQYPDLVEVFGPLGGVAKDAFYDLLDVFLFPTRWPQEAQPNVVYEAYAGGACNIAFGRGSIPEMIPADLGLIVPVGGDFAQAALPYLEAFWRERHDPAPRNAKLHAWIAEQVTLSASQRRTVMAAIAGDGGMTGSAPLHA
ncbi:glycosyltransferase family 4 protein [Sphingomonas desiccabilis]|uniref:Glycosyltransferase family 1 protein n=1 Tax=Sphingomonas desiccabilis TaxID=429134 RepID=A0A4Q2IZM9_9SPHN|nr:glycosyltransferase family 4 protein [Sphingomonas desiccabilis]MBB3912707.1 glycosyltransferase involved in cell wall biosynthesis [Sphingomonas desiccabilis]RXZ34671.1 glycosyltransferase family 1 protein [Sphingomonas desiccabilis]